jgi:hypothetical protein
MRPSWKDRLATCALVSSLKSDGTWLVLWTSPFGLLKALEVREAGCRGLGDFKDSSLLSIESSPRRDGSTVRATAADMLSTTTAATGTKLAWSSGGRHPNNCLAIFSRAADLEDWGGDSQSRGGGLESTPRTRCQHLLAQFLALGAIFGGHPHLCLGVHLAQPPLVRVDALTA